MNMLSKSSLLWPLLQYPQSEYIYCDLLLYGCSLAAQDTISYIVAMVSQWQGKRPLGSVNVGASVIHQVSVEGKETTEEFVH